MDFLYLNIMINYYVYILYSAQLNKYYVGQTQNLEERIKRHCSNHQGFTGVTKDWKLVYREVYTNRKEAIEREQAIKKKKSRRYIEYLIGNASF